MNNLEQLREEEFAEELEGRKQRKEQGKEQGKELEGLGGIEQLEGEEGFFSLIIRKAREKAIEDRNLQYGMDEIGITALLQCPYKMELRRRYPEIKAEAAAIDEGFRFEQSMKNACKDLFKGKVKVYEEFELPYEAYNQKIRGHLDLVIEKEDEVIGLELKAPQILFLKRLPSREQFKTSIIYDSEKKDEYLIVNPTYKLQAKIEKFLLQRMFNKPVRLFLFQSGLCKYGSFIRKFYTFYEVEAISQEELDYLVLKFINDKSPRYQNECDYYCCYNEVCDIREDAQDSIILYEINEELEKVVDPSFKATLSLYKQYCELKESLKFVEKMLKKNLVGSIKIGGKEIGWVEREVVEYDIDAIVDYLRQKNISLREFLTVTSSPKKRRLIENVIHNAVIKKDKQKVFKL